MFPARIANITTLAIMLIAASTAFAGDSEEEIKLRMGAGDPVAGKEKSTICQTCHGEDGNSAATEIPKLAGQFAAYIQKQVNDFKSGIRKDPVMSEMAVTVASDQDLLDIAAYFASQKQMKGAEPIHNMAGRARYMGSITGCRTCHGQGGKNLASINPMNPVINGQHKDYLVKQLKNYKNHTRVSESGAAMSLITGYMTEKDIEDVASYVSGL